MYAANQVIKDDYDEGFLRTTATSDAEIEQGFTKLLDWANTIKVSGDR